MALNLEHADANNGTGVTEIDIGTVDVDAPTLEIGELLLVYASISGNKTATVTMGALTLTLVNSQNTGGTQGVTVSLYRGLSASQISNTVINIDQGNTSAICGRYEIWSGNDTSGTNGSAAVEDNDVGTGTDDAPTVDTDPISDDVIVSGLVAHETQDFTIDASYTAGTTDLEAGAGSFITRLSTGYKSVASPATTTWDGSLAGSENWATLAFVIKPAAAGGTTAPHYYYAQQ